MKKPFGTLLKIGISLGLLSILIYKTDPIKILQSFQAYSPGIVLMAIGISFLAVLVAAAKWHILLSGYPFSSILEMSLIHTFYSLVLFGQLTGDLARVYKMTRQGNQHAFAEITTSVLFDRITGFFSLTLVGIIGIVLTHQPFPGLLTWLLSGMIFMSALTLFSMRFSVIYNLIAAFMTYCTGPEKILPERLSAHLVLLLETVHLYSQKTLLCVISTMYGVIIQLLCIATICLFAHALEISVAFIDWCWIFAAMTILLFFPVSISGIGVREGGFVGLLGLQGIASEKAMALSFSLFSVQVVLGLVGGIIEFKSSLKRKKNMNT